MQAFSQVLQCRDCAAMIGADKLLESLLDSPVALLMCSLCCRQISENQQLAEMKVLDSGFICIVCPERLTHCNGAGCCWG